jgi:DinB family protein
MTTLSTTDYIRDLETTVDDAAAWLSTLPESTVTWRPRPTAWCAKEIIGHLIDSAANNHQRFVRARGQDDLVFPGYEQDEWVSAQRYASAPWDEIVTLWHAYNRHLARVMAAVPGDVRYRKHDRHNLDQLGWQPYAADQPATLDDLMHDYVLHLKHHLSQVRDRERDAGATIGSS